MKRIHKLAVAGVIGVTTATLGSIGAGAPSAVAAPVGTCTSGPYWDSPTSSGIASCDGAHWRVNVRCTDQIIYGEWGGPRTAITKADECAGDPTTFAFTE